MSRLESYPSFNFKIKPTKEEPNRSFEIDERKTDVAAKPILPHFREEAIECFDQEALAANPVDEFATEIKSAHDLYEAGRDQEALTAYLDLLMSMSFESPELFEIYKNIGNIYVRTADFDAAEEFYNKAFTLNPDSDVLLTNYGTLEIQRGQIEKALECYRRAVEKNKNNDKAWTGLALIHRDYGDHELAWANVEYALDVNANNETALQLATEWAFKDHKISRLTELLEGVTKHGPGHTNAEFVLAKLLYAAGRVQEALNVTTRLGDHPGRPNLEHLIHTEIAKIGAQG